MFTQALIMLNQKNFGYRKGNPVAVEIHVPKPAVFIGIFFHLKVIILSYLPQPFNTMITASVVTPFTEHIILLWLIFANYL